MVRERHESLIYCFPNLIKTFDVCKMSKDLNVKLINSHPHQTCTLFFHIKLHNNIIIYRCILINNSFHNSANLLFRLRIKFRKKSKADDN